MQWYIISIELLLRPFEEEQRIKKSFTFALLHEKNQTSGQSDCFQKPKGVTLSFWKFEHSHFQSACLHEFAIYQQESRREIKHLNTIKTIKHFKYE